MSHSPRHRDKVRKHRVIRIVAISVASVMLVAVATGFFVYRHLEGNIDSLDVTAALGDDRPEEIIPEDVEHKPLNILLVGSDTREGQDGNIGGDTPGLSDTTILLHVAADRDRAYGVSIPRDLMVERPTCQTKDGEGEDPGGLDQFNAAYAIGGPACTIRTVEQMSDVKINHFVVIDFNGFRSMVDALNGVPVCVPEEVNDDIGKIYLPAGSYEVKGQQALSYVRLRHELSENGDIGRMKRQQAFLASMANKAISAGTLVNPVRLYNFLDAATSSVTTDPGLASLKQLGGLAKQLKDIGLEKIQFLSIPFEAYEPDPNRLQLAPGADRIWDRLREDSALTKRQSLGITTAAQDPDGPSGEGTGKPGKPDKDEVADAEARAEAAAANGLCA